MHREAVIQKIGAPSISQPRASVRKPEEVKFRTIEEEKATQELSRPPRRDTSADANKPMGLNHFEIIGMMGQGSYGKVYLA